MSQAVLDATGCANCGASMYGQYCAQCGQKVMPRNPTVGDVLREAAHELFHLDGKLLRTVRPLFTRPGLLTREIFEGRRARYVPPLRLYLIFSVAAFAVMALTAKGPIIEDNDLQEMRDGIAVTGEGPTIGIDVDLTLEERRRIQQEFITTRLPQVMFLLVPLFAWLVKLVNRTSGRNYPQHLYFALHIHAVYFGLLVLTAPLELPDHELVNALTSLGRLAFILTYFAMALRTVYGGSWRRAVVKTFLLFVVYMTCVGIAIGGVAVALVLLART
jgi:hypothetical protein